MWQRSDSGLVDGQWVIQPGLSEEWLAAFYLDMVNSGVVDRVFHTGKTDIRWFLNWVTAPNSVVMAAWQRPTVERNPILAGVGFVNNIVDYGGFIIAEVGFAFTELMGADQKSIFRRIHLTKGMIHGVFEYTKIDSIKGCTPEPNEGAVALVRRIGMRVFGPIPNYSIWRGRPCGAYISQTDRATWLNLADSVI